MKSRYMFFGLLGLMLFWLVATSFADKQPKKLKFKELNLEFVPIADGVYMSTTEISNGQYLEFLYSLIEQGRNDEYKQHLPDTTLWRQPFQYGEPYVEYYHRHTAYRNYPVVTIDMDDAQAFAYWLAGEVSKDKKLAGKTFEVGLPTEAEWYAALGGKNTGLMSLQSKKGLYNYNVKTATADVAAGLNDNANITAPVMSYHPNEKGIYNLIGNVAELTAEGYIKGGSWDDKYEDISPEARQDHPVPGPQVGFRVLLRLQ